MSAAWRWLVDDWQWPYGGTLAAVPLLVLVPILWSAEGAALALVCLLLPLYMLHQLEEHAGERFRRYVNDRLGRGSEIMGRALIFWVNVLGVWALFLAVLLLAFYIDLGLGLIAIYVTAANALTHLVVALATRTYNPGLLSAILLLAPAATAGAFEIDRAADPGAGVQLLAIAIAVGVHAMLIAILARRRAHAL